MVSRRRINAIIAVVQGIGHVSARRAGAKEAKAARALTADRIRKEALRAKGKVRGQSEDAGIAEEIIFKTSVQTKVGLREVARKETSREALFHRKGKEKEEKEKGICISSKSLGLIMPGRLEATIAGRWALSRFRV